MFILLEPLSGKIMFSTRHIRDAFYVSTVTEAARELCGNGKRPSNELSLDRRYVFFFWKPLSTSIMFETELLQNAIDTSNFTEAAGKQ